jgi:hypothetical protein
MPLRTAAYLHRKHSVAQISRLCLRAAASCSALHTPSREAFAWRESRSDNNSSGNTSSNSDSNSNSDCRGVILQRQCRYLRPRLSSFFSLLTYLVMLRLLVLVLVVVTGLSWSRDFTCLAYLLSMNDVNAMSLGLPHERRDGVTMRLTCFIN